MKRILLCSDRGALVYEWRNGRFGGNKAFEATTEGLREFEDYIELANPVPIHVLVDVTEEEFHPTSVPYVVGRDRKAVLTRAVNKYFRNTEFKHVVHQGREDFGRKDIKLLTSGVIDDEVLTVWLQRLQAAKVPIVGIYSMPLIGEALLDSLGFMKKRVLLVSQQSNGTLRQSFYDQGKLRLSRLAYHQTDKELLDPQQIIQDIDNTWLYLKGQRAVGRNELVDICIVGTESLVASLQQKRVSEHFQRCTVISQLALARQMGIKGDLPSPYADGIFAHVLCKKRTIKNHYAPNSVRKHYHHRLLAHGLYAISVLSLFGAVAITTNNYYTTISLERHARQAMDEHTRVRLLKSEYIRDSDMGIAPELVRSAVLSTEVLEKLTTPTIKGVFIELAGYVSQHDEIVMDSVQWTISNEHNKDIAEFQPRSRIELIRAQQSSGQDPSPWLEQFLIKGRVQGASRAYRHTMTRFERFVDDLKSRGRFTQVKIVQAPYSLDNTQTFQGSRSDGSSAQDLARRSSFTIAVAREVHHGEE